jgi:steroid delta-isomerase-like uncharacterized protein
VSVEQNKTTCRRLYDEVFSKGNLSSINQLVDSKFVGYDPAFPEPTKGSDGFRDFVSSLRSAFPDLSMKVENIFGEGDFCCARWSATGTHRGDFMGISPTNKRFSITGTDTFRFSGGKVVENYCNWDTLGFFKTLGVIPELELESSMA